LKMAVFWAICHQGDSLDVGGSKHLWNVGELLPDYTAQETRKLSSSYSPPWESQMLQIIFVSINLYHYSKCFHTCTLSQIIINRVDPYAEISQEFQPQETPLHSDLNDK
jgi:hypothetical protein